MAAADYYSGRINDQRLYVYVSDAQSIDTNTSTVSVSVYLQQRNGRTASDSNTLIGLSIGGTSIVWWQGYASYTGASHLIATGSRTISHNADGTSGGAVVDAGIYFPSLGWNPYLVVTHPLATIPRATTPNLVGGGGFVTGAAKTINLPRASSGFTHDVSFKVGSTTGVIASGAGVTTSWTPTHDLLTTAASGTAEITVVTKQGATVIGTRKVSYALEVDAAVVPTVSTVLWDDQNPVVKTAIGAFVQGQSLVKGTVTAAGAAGSTITSKHLVLGGQQVGEADIWQPTSSGTVTAAGHATDSRGRTASKAANFTVLAYAPPAFTQALVRRATSAAGAIGDGAYLRMDLTALVQSLMVGGAEKNALKLLVKTRPLGGAFTTRNDTTHSGLSYDNALVMVAGGAVYPIGTTFEVEITVSDNAGNQAKMLRLVGPGGASFDIGATGTGHGKLWERGAVDADGDVYSTGKVEATAGVYHGAAILSPLGSVTQWLTDTPPAGWLLCQGQAVSRTTYAALFALLGTTYGAGNGSTTFSLPDLRGRVPVGKSTDPEFNELGKTAGTKTHTLTTAEMPAHNHASGNNGGHFAFGGDSNASGPASGSGFRTALTSITSGNRGDGAAHNNIQPSITVNFIIRAI